MSEKKNENILAKWEIAEYEKHKRGILWYLVIGGGALALFIHAIWTLNFLFALIIVIAATIVIIHEVREPDMLTFKITPKGIELDDNFIPFKEIKQFWIIYEPPEVKNLYFHVNRTFRSELSIPLINMNPVFIRNILLKYLKEDLGQKDMSTSDQLGRILKF